MAGTRGGQGLAVLAPVRGNGESWSGGCGAELKTGRGRTRCVLYDRPFR